MERKSEANWINRKEINIEDAKKCSEEYDCSLEVATVLLKRDLNIEEFTSLLEHSPYLLKDITEGVEIISNAIRNNERIVVVNDYDVDGATSGFIMFEGIRRCGGIVSVISPDRVIDGYGISNRIIDRAKEIGAKLIVTTDNGISAIEQVDYAKSLGLKVVITDHHEIPYEENTDGTKTYLIPNADAVINPKQVDDEYPYKEICGALVAFKVIQVLIREFIYDDEEISRMLDRYRELVCLGTVCDVMALENENRTFVKDGLRLLKRSSFIGLRALINELKINSEKLSSYTIGYQIGPCINATSRMTGSIKLALKLFSTEDTNEAQTLAKKIVELNEERKEICRESEEQVKEDNSYLEDKVIILYIPNQNPALMGIIAGDITEEYNKPCVCLTDDKEGILKGSGRSIKGYNMFEYFSKHKDLFVKFGGHEGAIGLSINKDNVDTLRKALNEDVKELNNDIFIKNVLIDLFVDMEDVRLSTIKELETLEPFGEKNPPVVMCQLNIKLTGLKRMGSNNNCLRLIFENENGGHYEAVMFNRVDELDSLIKEKYSEDILNALYDISRLSNESVNISVLYKASINSYKGTEKPQCIINDFKI